MPPVLVEPEVPPLPLDPLPLPPLPAEQAIAEAVPTAAMQRAKARIVIEGGGVPDRFATVQGHPPL